jgi:selenocysteine lyase/cysteine desulfurase
VVSAGDFPANIYPWLNLKHLGVQVDMVPQAPDGSIELDELCRRLGDRTRLVALSSIHYASGTPLDIDAVGALLRARGILFCVDAIQSLGAVPCSARLADALVADAHKWLLGPQGAGLLVVRREAIPRIRPILAGWKSVIAPADFHRFRFELADSARRYEPGSLNAVGLVGLHAALSLLEELGIAAIAGQLRALRTLLIEGLRARGYRLLGVASPGCPTGITSFRTRGDAAVLRHRLGDAGCVVSMRKDEQGGGFLRVSPHFYNTPEEVCRFLDLLDAVDVA